MVTYLLDLVDLPLKRTSKKSVESISLGWSRPYLAEAKYISGEPKPTHELSRYIWTRKSDLAKIHPIGGDYLKIQDTKNMVEDRGKTTNKLE